MSQASAAPVLGHGRFPLSNRGETGQPLATSEPRAELDTVGIAVPIRDADPVGATVSIVKAGTPEEFRTFRRKLPRGGFMAWGMGHVAWVEASLPKRAGEDNVQGVGIDETWELLADLHDEAGQWAEWDRDRDGHRFETSKVTRVDLVRDFDGVRSAPFLLDGLNNVPVKGRAKRKRFADGERNRAQTLSVGPMRDAWRATLYDKHEETLGKPYEAPEGRLRFEARMRSDVLTGQWAKAHGGNLVQVMDIKEEKVAALRRGMFERVGYDREVSAPGRLADVVLGADLTDTERRNLWAYLTLGPYGGNLGFSRMTERKYRRMAEEMGVVMMDLDEAGGPNIAVTLDYDRGQEVCRVAA